MQSKSPPSLVLAGSPQVEVRAVPVVEEAVEVAQSPAFRGLEAEEASPSYLTTEQH